MYILCHTVLPVQEVFSKIG